MTSASNQPKHFLKLPFTDRVYLAVKSVPAGWVTTYGDVAIAAGSPRAARQVGFALSRLSGELEASVPWHRVINGKGFISLRGDTGRGTRQRYRLEAEGIPFSDTGRIPLDEKRWHYPDWI